jgi:hypothetical protein
MVPPRRPYRPPEAGMSRQAIERLPYDGTASWASMNTIKPFNGL